MGFPHRGHTVRDFEYHIRHFLHHLNNIELVEGLEEALYHTTDQTDFTRNAEYVAKKIKEKISSYQELENSLKLIDKHRTWIDKGLSSLDPEDKSEIHRMLKRIHKIRFKLAPSGLFKTKGLVAHQLRMAALLEKQRYAEFKKAYKYLQEIYEKTSEDMRKVLRAEKKIAHNLDLDSTRRRLSHKADNRGPNKLVRIAAGVLIALGLAEQAAKPQAKDIDNKPKYPQG